VTHRQRSQGTQRSGNRQIFLRREHTSLRPFPRDEPEANGKETVAAEGIVHGRLLWPLASITKLFTAAAVMRLVELGELTVNTPVWQIDPEFSGDGREDVRVRHLLTHTSGLPYESPEMGARLAAHMSVAELIDEGYEARLLFAPGTRFQYSDFAYGLAGRVAELVAGRPYPEVVRALVLEPMGLADTFMLPEDGGAGRIAAVRGVFNDGTDGAMYNSAYGRSLAHPAFSAVSTLGDMVRFLRHFAPGGPRTLSDATVRAMTSPQTAGAPGEHPLLDGFPPDAVIPWGFGFALQTEAAPAVFSELASVYPPKQVSNPASPLAAANGQFLLIRRDVYFDLGGHRLVGKQVLEDVALARAVKRANHAIRFRYAPEALSTRMYSTVEEMIQGWTKNLALLFPRPIFLAAMRMLQFLLFFLLPPIALGMAGLLFWQRAAILLVWLRACWGFYGRVARAHFPAADTAVSILGVPIFAWLLIRSAASKTVDWKGRRYSSRT